MGNTQYGDKRVSTKDYAYLEIKNRIMKGELIPDESIVEERLSTELVISRTPLREALQRLEYEELVVRQHNGRLKVAPISIQEVKELFEVRKQLESIVVAQATDKITELDKRRLRNLVQVIKKSDDTDEEDILADILYYGGKFHTYIYELSANKTVNKILLQLNDRIFRYRRLIPFENKERLTQSAAEHKHILDLMEKGDKAGAVEAMVVHIENSLECAVNAIKRYMHTDGEINNPK
ncbi:GntR family transcriptional regulator [Virgibacillus soli]|uniref:GntR family transcriptional regulator n=1 Tax=Paracerasibacillus soli TaxID=480284 RepID=A0ABU5CVW3_9BACI|nr:GntR family transcriptional regulator [Virgibacillus soli]MDY0410390.1 GntR family transcriptional regulator [Virgibacillus soli]